MSGGIDAKGVVGHLESYMLFGVSADKRFSLTNVQTYSRGGEQSVAAMF